MLEAALEVLKPALPLLAVLAAVLAGLFLVRYLL